MMRNSKLKNSVFPSSIFTRRSPRLGVKVRKIISNKFLSSSLYLTQKVALLLVLFGIASQAQGQPGVFFEAECTVVGNEWIIDADPSASEGFAVSPINNRTTNPLTGNQPAADVLEYQVTIPVPGTYDVYVRAFVNGSGDSIFYSDDDNVWYTANTLSLIHI